VAARCWWACPGTGGAGRGDHADQGSAAGIGLPLCQHFPARTGAAELGNDRCEAFHFTQLPLLAGD
jgi:hypothetical protein